MITLLLLLATTFAHASGTSIGNLRPECNEGAVDTHIQINPDDSSQYITEVCVGGQWSQNASWAATARATKTISCREGQTEYFPNNGEGEGSNAPSSFICRRGRFVPLYPQR